MVTASEMAARFGVTRARVSQWVREGKLEGCYTGAGRQRRFDIARSAQALGKRLDHHQMMENGARTRAALRDLGAIATAEREEEQSELGRYQIARAEKAEQEARRIRRENMEYEGQYVLASEWRRLTMEAIERERRSWGEVLETGAARIAQELGVDQEAAASLLKDGWEEHLRKRDRSSTVSSTDPSI